MDSGIDAVDTRQRTPVPCKIAPGTHILKAKT